MFLGYPLSLKLDLQPSRLVLLGIVLAYMRKIAQNVQKSFAAGAPPRPAGEIMTLPQTLSRQAGDRINSQHSLDCHLTSNVPSMKRKQFSGLPLDTMRQRLTLNSNTKKSDIAKKTGDILLKIAMNITINRLYYTFACCLHGLWKLTENNYVGPIHHTK